MSQRARGAINENKVVICVHGSRQKTREVGAVRLRWADTASIPARRRKKPTNDKKQALPASQKPRTGPLRNDWRSNGNGFFDY